MPLRLQFLAAALVCALAQPALAADPMDAFKKAAGAVKVDKGEASEELSAFDEAHAAAVEAWQAVPFQIRKIALTDEKAVGSGMYKERGNSTYKTGDSIFVYLEPVGYAWKEKGENLFAFGFVADLTIKSAKGEVLYDKKALIDGEFTSHKKNMEAYMSASIDLETLPDGDYVLEFVVHDKQSNATTTATQTFTYKNTKAPEKLDGFH